MIKGTTKTGFEFELEDEVLDDYELLEILAEVDQGNYGLITKMVTLLLGEEQKEALKVHIRANSKRVSAKKLLDEVTEIFQASNSLKN